MKLIYFVSITICASVSIDFVRSQQQTLNVSRVGVEPLRSDAFHALRGFVQVALFKCVAFHVSAVAACCAV